MEDKIRTLVSNIKEGTCVLFLGPELLVDAAGKNYKDYFKELVQEHSGINYFPKDNLFWLQPASVGNTQARPAIDRLTLIRKLAGYYESVGDEILMNLIFQMPFPLIINVCPDMNLNKIFKRNGFAPQEGVSFDRRNKNLQPPTIETPLIYHMLGRLDNRQSLILTHKDLFGAIKELMQKDSIPDDIISTLKSATSYLFLGFRFETWYYQLLLSIVDFDDNEISIRIGAPEEKDTDIVSVMTSYFRLFFNQHNPLQFMQEVYEQLKAEKVPLRQPLITPEAIVFVSYAWQDEARQTGEWLLDRLTADAEKNKINILRDKKELDLQDSIREFMNRIGMGKAVLMIISDKYLKSDYCLYEAMKVYQNENFNERVFLAVLEDVDFSDQSITAYTSYWNAKKEELAQLTVDEVNKDSLPTMIGQADKLKTITQISLFVGEFLYFIKDKIHYRLPVENFQDNSAEQEQYLAFFIKMRDKLNVK